MFVALMHIVLVSSPVPSPLHTAEEEKKQKNSCLNSGADIAFLLFSNIIIHLTSVNVFYSVFLVGVSIMDKNFEFPIRLTNLDYEGKPK